MAAVSDATRSDGPVRLAHRRALLHRRPGRRGAPPGGLRGRPRVRHAAARGGARRVPGRLPADRARGPDRARRRGPGHPRAAPRRRRRHPRPGLDRRRVPRPRGPRARRRPALDGRRGRRPQGRPYLAGGVRRRGRRRRVVRGAQPPPPGHPPVVRRPDRLARGWSPWRPRSTPSCAWRWPRSSGPGATPATRSPPTPSSSTCSRRATSPRPQAELERHLADGEAAILERLGLQPEGGQ